MCEKACHKCSLADVVNDPTVVRTKQFFRYENGRLVDFFRSESEVAPPRKRYIRLCSPKGQTVEGYDSCISKLEFEKKT